MQKDTLSMTDEPSFSTTLKAIKMTNGLISFDPNLRKSLWKDLKLAKERILKVIKYANILKLSEEELYFLTDISDLKKAVEHIKQKFGTKIILITLGEKGSFYQTKEKSGYVEAMKVNPIDTTGAGDSFLAAFLYYFISNKNFNIEEALKFANTAAAITVTRRGAIPALPTLDEINNFKNKAPF